MTQSIDKTCTQCGQTKPVEEFAKHRVRKDGSQGYAAYCKRCDADRARRTYEKNSKVILERQAKYRSENKEAIREQKSEYYQNNKEIFLGHSRTRRARKAQVNERFTPEDKAFTLKVFQGQCFKCGSTEKLSMDHHLPLSKGHALTRDNAVVLCLSCNSSKGNRPLEDFYDPIEIMVLDSVFDTIRRENN